MTRSASDVLFFPDEHVGGQYYFTHFEKLKCTFFVLFLSLPPPLPPLKGLYTFELDFLSTYLAVHLSAEYGWLCLICLAITSLWSGREF